MTFKNGRNPREQHSLELKFPLLCRTKQRSQLLSFLSVSFLAADAKRLIIRGDSGTGKSYLLKNVLTEFLAKNAKKHFSLYADLSNDEFQSSRLINSLLRLALISSIPTKNYPTLVPKELTIEEYRKRSVMRRSIGWNIFQGVSKVTASLIGMGGALDTVISSNRGSQTEVDSSEIFFQYLKWVSNQADIILVIDNYQFLSNEIRLTVESLVNRLPDNIKLVIIDRTINGQSEIYPPLDNSFSKADIINVRPFSMEQTEKIVRTVFDEDQAFLSKLAKDIFSKTNGNAKDIEFCLLSYRFHSEKGEKHSDILGLVSTIDRLPVIHRQLLLIAAMLDGGVSNTIARHTVNRLGVYENSSIDRVILALVELSYLKFNSENGQRLRAGHERVIQSIREVADEDMHEEVRSALIDALSHALKESKRDESEEYLLHCIVGLQTLHELQKNLHFVSRLVRNQHRQEQFSYLVTLCDEAPELFTILPMDSVLLILDSHQKSSAFEKGLHFIQRLTENPQYERQELLLYEFKFLTQIYHYEQAIKVSDQLEKSDWASVYRVNLYLALSKNEEALNFAAEVLEEEQSSEAKAVMLRNTIVLFDSSTALRNLAKSRAYFEKSGSDFRIASIDTNESLVWLCEGDYASATRVLERAVKLMSAVGSREVFQAHLNFGLVRMQCENYDLAVDSLEKALSAVPNSLLLDQSKIEMALVLTQFLMGGLTNLELENKLQTILSQIKGTQMPYLRRTLLHNLAVIKNSSSESELIHESERGSNERVSLFIEVLSPLGEPFVVNPSIHWRY